MKRKIFFIGLLIAVITPLFAGSAFSATIGLRPVDPGILTPQGYIEVPLCTSFDVELYFEGLSALELGENGLVAMGLTIDWDPLVTFEDGVNAGELWSSMSFTQGSGPVIDMYADVAADKSPISQDHIIAILSLHCIGLGWTELIPRGTIPVPYNFALADGTYLDAEIDFQGISINQVPIPGTLLLLGSGLFALYGIYRRRIS